MVSFSIKTELMTTIAQFLGFLFFLCIAMAGFWCLTFLVSIIPYWVAIGSAEIYNKINKDVDPETVRTKFLPEQKGVILVWRK